MASTIGSLQIDILANIARLQDDMNKATRSVGGAMSSIEKSVGFAQKALVGLGVGISFAALIGQVNKAVDTLAKLDDMAQKTGSSVENLSRLQKVASQFGQDFGAVDTAISKLAKGLAGIDDAGGKTAKALNAIGISQQFVKSNDPSQVLVQVARNLQNYQDGASKAALATDLFGKAGVEILPYLNDLAENVDKYTGSTAEAAAKAAAFQDALGGFKVKIDEASTSIATSLLPAFDQIITKFNEAVKEGGLLLGIIKGIGEVGKITLFGTDRAKQENIYKNTLPNAMAQIGRELKDQNLTSQERIKKQVELNFLAKEYNALAIQLGKVEKASPYVSPASDKPVLDYKGEEAAKALAAAQDKANKEAQTRRENENEEKLKEIQKQIDFEEDLKETAYKSEMDNEKKQSAAKMKLQEDAFEMDKKFIGVLDKLQTKAIDERTEKQIKAAEEVAKKQEELAKDINRSLTDALLRGFEKGKSFAQNFRDTLVNMFQTLVLRPIISAVIDGSGITKLVSGASGAIASAFSGGASASTGGASAGGGLGGMGDLFSMGKSLFGNGGVQGSLISSIENLGTIFSNGMGGLSDSIGGFLGANAGMIADVLPFAGAALQLLQGNTKGAAFTAIGAAVGSFIPVIGTALGGLIGSFVGSLFGGKDYKRFGTTVSGVKVGQEEYAKTGEGKIYDRKIAGIADPLNNLNEAFSNTLSTLFKSFDIESTINTTTGMFQRGKSKKSGGVFNATVDGINTGQMKVQLKKASMEQVYNALVDMVMGEGLVRAIKASKLSSDIKSLFDGFTDKTQVTALIQATMNLNGAQAELASRFGITVDQSAQAAKSTGLVGQALIDYVNKLTASAMAFATVGDQLIKFRTSLENVYGGGLPDTLKAYDAALKGIDKTTQEGIDTFVELFGMRDQFAQFRQAIDGLKGNVRGALFGMVSDAEKQQMLNEDLAKLFGDLGRDVPGSIQELIALGKSIDYTTAEGLNLAAVFPTLVNAFNQTQAAVDNLVNSLRDANNFKTLIDYQRYTGIARNYGNAFANNYADTMPSYDVGTSYVPNDGVAMLHQGEAVLTRGENTSLRESNAQLVGEIRTLNAKVDRLVYSMDKTASSTKRTADIMTNITPNGDAIQTEAVA
jgi:hypothetical protein